MVERLYLLEHECLHQRNERGDLADLSNAHLVRPLLVTFGFVTDIKQSS